MRKDSAKRVEETYWIVAPPSGHFGQLTEPQSQCGKKHTTTHVVCIQYSMHYIHSIITDVKI